MDKHLVKKITIQNFKCFKSLKVDNLCRANLLGGDNNVGKSAFLEVLEITTKTENFTSLITTIKEVINRRQHTIYDNRMPEFDVIAYEQKIVELKTNNNSIIMEIKPKEQLSKSPDEEENSIVDGDLYIEITINKKTDSFAYDKFNNGLNWHSPLIVRRYASSNGNISFIPSTQLEEKELSTIYGTIVDMGMMKDIDNFLRSFDTRIESLVIRPTEGYSVFKVKLKDMTTPVLLSSMGSGLNRYLAIVCAIWKSKDGQLLIDEIENGIFYAKYEKLWEIIFQTSREANCQVFATTHSKECIEAFSRIAEKYDHENIKYVNFSRTTNDRDKIVATVLDSIGLEDNFQLGLDLR